MEGQWKTTDREREALKRMSLTSMSDQVTAEDLRIVADILCLPNLVKFIPSSENVAVVCADEACKKVV